MRALPVPTLAVLACGLPAESRTMRRELGTKITAEQTLFAAIVDRLSLLVWMQTKDGHRGVNRPPMILSELNRKTEEKPQAFASAADFEAARAKILGGGAHGD